MSLKLDSIVDEYLDEYECDGDDGVRAPSKGERDMIKDAIMGLLEDEAFMERYLEEVQRHAYEVS